MRRQTTRQRCDQPQTAIEFFAFLATVTVLSIFEQIGRTSFFHARTCYGTFSQSAFRPHSQHHGQPVQYYAQDNWRVRANLTITYGFRHVSFSASRRTEWHAWAIRSGVLTIHTRPLRLGNCGLGINAGRLDTSLNASGQIVSVCNPKFRSAKRLHFCHPPEGVTGQQNPRSVKGRPGYNRGIALGWAWLGTPGRTARPPSVRPGDVYDNGQEFGNAENDIFLGSGFQHQSSVSNATIQNPTGGCSELLTGCAATTRAGPD